MRKQERRRNIRGFTLVEIMIVIVIIIMLTQIGNMGTFFRQKERSQTEEISLQILGKIDEEKINALLGKTQDGDIVKKRKISITLDNAAHTISAVSKVNLAKSDDNIYEADMWEKTWELPVGLSGSWYACDGNTATPLDTITTVNTIFFGDAITFTEGKNSTETPLVVETANVPHVVLKLQKDDIVNELHIDRRTGLTYMRNGSANTLFCN